MVNLLGKRLSDSLKVHIDKLQHFEIDGFEIDIK